MAASPVSDFAVRSRLRDYEVRFANDAFADLRQELRAGDVILLDQTVRRLYAERLDPILAAQPFIEVVANETQKSYRGAEPVFDRLIEGGFRKQHRLIAIGGGITQDLTAFIASLLYRGVDWVFYPTTLLAQADSCIGSKTSINFGATKNQLGGFYPPRHIVIDLSFLDSLPALERRSGIGEMAHYFLVAGEADFERFRREAPRALEERDVLRGLVERSLEIKRGFIERDEFDRGERQVLNYGHTFGHALESLTNYRVPHGIAVSYGMDLANYVSVQLGYLPEEARTRARATLEPIWAGVPIGALDQSAYEAALRKDKKNAEGRLGLILTRGFGRMFKELVPLDSTFSAWVRTWFAETAR
jgi:3-dehydroquinate synthase